MTDLTLLLQELTNQLPNIVLDDNCAYCIRFQVGEETWKLHVEADNLTNEVISLLVKRRD